MYSALNKEQGVLKLLSFYLLILYAFSILLIPKKLFIESFGFRAEDIVSFISLIAFLVFYNSTSAIPRKIFNAAFLYFGYLLLISLIRDLDYAFNIFTIFFKEFSYFALFFFAYFFSINTNKEKIRLYFEYISFISIVPLAFVLYQLIFLDFFGVYGVSIFGHEVSPLSSGMILFTIFIHAFFYEAFIKRNLISEIYIFLIPVMLLFVGSKTSILGILVFIISFEFLFNSMKTSKRAIIILVSLFFMLIIAINSKIGELHRLESFFDPINAILNRDIWWKFYSLDTLGYFFGMGIGEGHINKHTGNFSMTMAYDNQFLYLFITLGIIGSIFFAYLIYILGQSIKNKEIKRFYNSFLLSFLLMGMGAEIFQLSVSGFLFWSITGFLLGFSRIKT